MVTVRCVLGLETTMPNRNPVMAENPTWCCVSSPDEQAPRAKDTIKQAIKLLNRLWTTVTQHLKMSRLKWSTEPSGSVIITENAHVTYAILTL